MFTNEQIKAIQELRYRKRHIDERRPRRPRRDPGSLEELLTALAGGLASIGERERKGKVRPASPAF